LMDFALKPQIKRVWNIIQSQFQSLF